ncbi:MAG: DUF1614 domain-containing protein [Planctomycetales bacterium]
MPVYSNDPFSGDPMRTIRLNGCLVLLAAFFMLCILPMMFVNMLQDALQNLHLSPEGAFLVLMGMFVGSVINLPLYSIPRPAQELITPDMLPHRDPFNLPPWDPTRRETLVAVNVGGCLVPLLLAAWLLPAVMQGGPRVLTVLGLGVLANCVVCYRWARSIPGLGIALPTFLPSLVALIFVWLGLAGPQYDPFQAPVAYLIGISGPLIGADLMHWRDFRHIATGMVSIGGAGTWDGIVLSGLMAAFLV